MTGTIFVQECKSQVIWNLRKNEKVMSKNTFFVLDSQQALCPGRVYGTPLDTLHFYLSLKLKLERVGVRFLCAPCISRVYYELCQDFFQKHCNENNMIRRNFLYSYFVTFSKRFRQKGNNNGIRQLNLSVFVCQ